LPQAFVILGNQRGLAQRGAVCSGVT